jgi:hypothetical protein
MQDLSALAPGLTRDAEGIWRARGTSPVDYPDEAHACANRGSRRSLSVLAGERALIRRGSRIPMGSSCLVVARRPSDYAEVGSADYADYAD